MSAQPQAVLAASEATPSRPLSLDDSPAMSDITPLELRRALGRFATGVTVITTRDASGKPIGLTANSFTSVSMDPPLVLWCLASRSANRKAFEQASSFAINVLSRSQEGLCRQFSDPKVVDRFAGVAWHPGASGAPLLEESLVQMECVPWDLREAGDHLIMIGRVNALQAGGGEPLVFSTGKLGGFAAA